MANRTGGPWHTFSRVHGNFRQSHLCLTTAKSGSYAREVNAVGQDRPARILPKNWEVGSETLHNHNTAVHHHSKEYSSASQSRLHKSWQVRQKAYWKDFNIFHPYSLLVCSSTSHLAASLKRTRLPRARDPTHPLGVSSEASFMGSPARPAICAK